MGSRDSGVGIRGSGFEVWALGAGLMFLLAWGAPPHARANPAAPSDGGLRIIVRVYNYAGVSGGSLAKAEEEASRIFREVGVELAWLDCPTSHDVEEKYPACGLSSGALPVDLRILPSSMAARVKSSRDELGLAVPSAQAESASAAWVFYERAEQLAASEVASRAQILGHAIAHEIGHLLLGPDHHSSRGIMRANWRRRDLEEASRGQLLFTRAQSKLIRANVQARSAMPEPSLTRLPAR
jgi:hypothetical protein